MFLLLKGLCIGVIFSTALHSMQQRQEVDFVNAKSAFSCFDLHKMLYITDSSRFKEVPTQILDVIYEFVRIGLARDAIGLLSGASSGKIADTDILLSLAASAGKRDAVKLLLLAGADKNKATVLGETPLYSAVCNGHEEIATLLLNAGVDKDKTAHTGETPVYCAVKNNQKNILKNLLFAGADKDKALSNEWTDLHLESVGGVQSGLTPLARAVIDSNDEMVKILLVAHADKNVFLYDRNASLLLLAAERGYVEGVNRLLMAGADRDKADKLGITPLQGALLNSHTEVIELLVRAGADIDKVRADGATPLFVAAQNGHALIVELLLLAGADKDKARVDGATPLFFAAQNGHARVVELLLLAGVDIDKE